MEIEEVLKIEYLKDEEMAEVNYEGEISVPWKN